MGYTRYNVGKPSRNGEGVYSLSLAKSNMVSLYTAKNRARSFYVEFDNSNWIYVPFSSASSFAGALRDVAQEGSCMEGDYPSMRRRDFEREFSFGKIEYRAGGGYSDGVIEISCSDGHWAKTTTSEAKQLVRLIRDEGY